MATDVIAWLRSPAGTKWSRRTHSRDAMCYHDIIELVDDFTCDEVAEHSWVSSPKIFKVVKFETAIWKDLPWNPDLSP